MSHTDRPKLLLVDDCILERDLYEIVLQPEFQVVTASRGVDALNLAAAEQPDVVVLDVLMPGLDGWETCTRLKGDPRTAATPVVLLTAADDYDLSMHAAVVGAAAVVNKPCSADRLLDRINTVLARKIQLTR